MIPRFSASRRHRLAATTLCALALSGCASVQFDSALDKARLSSQGFVPASVELRQSDAQRQASAARSAQLLAQPLSMQDAVELALANNPAVQTLLAQSWADMAVMDQSARLANPLFTFERTKRLDEVELSRSLSIGLLDLLTLPKRQDIARSQQAQATLQLGSAVVDSVAQVRMAWVRAVAAEQSAQYAEQVHNAAQASAELATRMQQAGNFNKLQRARQQAFYADAVAQLALARHAATAAREDLVRQLGLDTAQATALKLPERLPDLPAEPRPAGTIASTAMQQRLDVQQARLQLEGAGKEQGISFLHTIADVELGLRSDTVTDQASGQTSDRKGYALAIRLPVFDWGGAQRQAMDAQTLAAANRYDSVVRTAASQLRENYSAYRTAYELARHYRDEIVPLRKTMAQENLLRYNGMLIGVFELIAETREQISRVIAAIHAEQQFWMADVALSTTLLGKLQSPNTP